MNSHARLKIWVRLTSARQVAARDQRGLVLGAEGLLFAVLVLLGGTLMLVNAWAIIDTRMALDAAARDYLRAYTESAAPDAALVDGDRAARRSLSERPHLSALSVTPPDAAAFGPCQSATVRLTVSVPAVRLPFVAGMGQTHVTVVHTELVDAHREMTDGVAYDPAAVPCADG